MKDIPSLTSLRGFAAILVILFHYSDTLNIIEFPVFQSLGTLRTTFISRGYIWVDLFFILSGFLLSYSLPSKKINYFKYISRRISRIHPLHIVVTVFFVLMIKTNIINQVEYPPRYLNQTIPFQFFLLQSWGFSNPHSWNYPAWSLSVEFFLYLVFPLLSHLLILKKNQFNFVFLILYQFLILYYFGYILEGNIETPGQFHYLLRGFIHFTNGIFIYCVHHSLRNKKIVFSKSSFILNIALIIYILSSFKNIAYVLPLFSYLIFYLSRENNQITHLISTPIFLHIGKISYSLYLWHIVIFELMGSQKYIKSQMITIVCTILILYVLSLITYHLIEIKMRTSIIKKFKL